MDNLCASGVDLLPEKSRLSQMNTATNKVNLIPSHYPPPGIAEAERTIGGTELRDGKFIVLSPTNAFPICVDFEQKGVPNQNAGSMDSVPPPLPPRESTGCSSAVVRPVPLPVSPSLKDALNKHQLPVLNLAQVGGQGDGPGGGGSRVNPNVGFDCFGTLTVHGEQREPILANPMFHHEQHRLLKNVDDITHHNWNAIQANLSHELVMSKDFYPTSQVLDDKHCDGSLKMAPTNLQATVLNQVIPLSRWPIGSRQPETHFALDRVIARPQTGNEYVDSPLHAPSKDVTPNTRSSAPTTTTARSESSLRDATAVIMTQPSPSGTKSSQEHAGKDGDRANSRQNPPPPPPCKQGLICPRCGKCRCMACTQPRHLPSCWIGRSFYQCECGFQQAVNCLSCLCCVQALFYHCLYHPDDEDDVVIEPCACCERPRCCLRWTIMGLLLPVLPCLCLYCPLQCALDACTSCYNGCSRRGCHCGRDISSSGSSTTRDLLLDSEPSST